MAKINQIILIALLASCSGQDLEDTAIAQELETEMSRDANGNNTLPAGNPVVSGTIIDTNWANPTMSDMSNEITDSLSRSGKGGMLDQFKAIDGTAGAPAVSFLNQLTMGMYRAADNDVRMSVNSTDSMRWTINGVQIWNGAQWEDILTGSNAIIDGPDPTLADSSAALVTGTDDPDTSPHLAYGLTTIQGKSNSTIAANMTINPYGGDVLIGARNAGPGEVQLWHDQTRSLQTISGGVIAGLSSSTNTRIFNNTIRADNNGTPATLSVNDLGSDVQIGDPTGENIVINLRNINADNNGTGTTLQLNPAGGPNAGVDLFWQGLLMASTVNSTVGGLFVNNLFTGGGLERVLTKADKITRIGPEYTGTGRAITSSDIFLDTECSNAGAVVLDIGSASGWEAGDIADFWYSGAGPGITFTASGGMTLIGGGTITTNKTGSIKYMGSNTFRYIGP